MGIALQACGPGDYDRGPMILEDLRSLPPNPLVVVEGALVTPEMASPVTDQLEGTGATTITVDDQTVEQTLAESRAALR
jgi:hypothetical protein